MSQFFASGGQSIGASASASVLPTNIQVDSLRTDWFDLLVVQGTLKSLLQDHSSKASILWHSTFFMVQLSHPYMTTGKTIALTLQTFVGKVMSLLFITLSRFVIAFPYVIACLLRGHNSTHCCEHLLFHLLQWEASPTSHQAPWGRTVQTWEVVQPEITKSVHC